MGQPHPVEQPPSYLRGWNHVELGPDGSLYAMVPLHALLRLSPDGEVMWSCEIAVHHDLDIDAHGRVHVLTERPRVVCGDRGDLVLLDNVIAVVEAHGRVRAQHSLYDILLTDTALRSLVRRTHERRWQACRDSGWSPASPRESALVERAEYEVQTRDALRLLRDLPGSPADVLHANSIELLEEHPAGLWKRGDVLLSLRNLDLIVVVDLLGPRVRWWWGPGTLSGQHQPSMLPNGHVLVFDNGRSQGRSRVLKCDPPTGDIVWQYEADPPETFFTELAGGCEAVNEDRVLVTDAQAGRAFEVDRDGHIVWEMHVILPATSARCSRASVYRVSVARADGVRRVLDQAVTQTPAELGIQVAVTPTSQHRRKGSLR